MEDTVMYGAVDVDEKSFHVALYGTKTDKTISFKSRPVVSDLLHKLREHRVSFKQLRLCYEATYLGFDLCRELRSKGLACDVIASSKIPTPHGRQVKTDRLDSLLLAEYFAKGLLTPVYVPDQRDEEIRDLIRSRALLTQQIKNIKNHFLSLCKRAGLNYRKSVGNGLAHYWTDRHAKWTEKQINALPEGSPLKFNLSSLLMSCAYLRSQIAVYDEKIKDLSETPVYKKKVKALECFRGLDTLTALTLVSELGDIRRFPHPTKVSAYAGLAIREYTSGGKERRFGITKQGNKYIRTVVVEACQYAFRAPKISRSLKDRRQQADPQIIEIADRCMVRLNKKAVRMLFKGHPRNKIKVACAREMLCFIWEALQAVA